MIKDMRFFKKYVISIYLRTYSTVSYEVCLADSILKKQRLSKSCKSVLHHKRNINKIMTINGFSLFNFLKTNFHESKDPGGVVVSSNLNIEDEDERMCDMVEVWLKGNIDSSFFQFTKLYEKGDYSLRRKLIKVLQQLMSVSIGKDGKAVVTNIIYHVKKFSSENNEWFLLMTVWYALIISNFYEDNCLSTTLLGGSSSFKTYLEQFIPYFGASFLKNDDVLLYQRLIETTLSHKMDNAAGILLRMLFDYYSIIEMRTFEPGNKVTSDKSQTVHLMFDDKDPTFSELIVHSTQPSGPSSLPMIFYGRLHFCFNGFNKTGYFMGCSAVYKCCIELEIKLTRDQIYKYCVLRKIDVEVKNKLFDFHHPKDIIYKF